MQTFLPYASYSQSMKVLDPSRLGNQVYREAVTLINGGWKNHPASKMWQGHTHHLALYTLSGIQELEMRNLHYPETKSLIFEVLESTKDTGPPKWLGREDFHASHRSNLLRKFPEWYKKFNWKEPDNLPYVWPTVTKPKPSAPRKLLGGRSTQGE